MTISFGARLASNARSQITALRIVLLSLGLSLGLMLTGPLAVAQESAGAIAGTVKDTSGAVLPGATVVASSPALIEKSRTTTTDASGAYRIVDLRPGTYSITFTLAGFQTVTQEGIEITQGFTANVNPALSVGAVTQQVTVTSASPLIDVQSTTQTNTVLRTELTQVPTSETYGSVAQLIPGNAPSAGQEDVGGSAFLIATTTAVHGGTQTDQMVELNGLDITTLAPNGGGSVASLPPEGEVESMNVQVGSEPADIATDGTFISIIPRTGGDQFHGGVFYNFGNSDTQWSNLSPYLKSIGFTNTTNVKNITSIQPYIGGPLLKGKVWFFIGGNYTSAATNVGDDYQNASTNPFTYIANTSEPGINNHSVTGASARFTWQASPKNRLGIYYDNLQAGDYHLSLSSIESPQVAPRIIERYPLDLQATWTSVLSPKLLFQVGWGREASEPFSNAAQMGANLPVTDSGIGFSWGGSQSPSGYVHYNSDIQSYTTSLAYTTGEHAIQVGAQFQYESIVDYVSPITLGPVAYTLKNGVSTSVLIYPGPLTLAAHILPNLGIYGEDKWTIKKRLTAIYGLRLDMLRTIYDAATDPAYTFTSAQVSTPCCRPQAYSAAGGTILDWKDLDPRLGAAYDLFGNGKTALKVNMSRYTLFNSLSSSAQNGIQQGGVSTENLAPTIGSQASETRTWNQANLELGITGADPLNPAPNGGPNCNTTTGANCILGKSSNSNFGSPSLPLALSIDPSFASGFAVRPHQWEFSAGVQQQIIPGVSFTANFIRRSYGNALVSNNLAANSASDYSPYCVKAPVDSRLPGGGGNQICGLYDLNPSSFGLPTDTVYDSASKFGGETAIWRGYDFLINMRLHGALVTGGLDTGTAITSDCSVVARIGNPATSNPITTLGNPSPLDCSQQTPYLNDLKIQGVYPLPLKFVRGFLVSAAFQSNPGPVITANAVFTNAQIAPSLGRNLSEGSTATVTLPLVKPGTEYGARANQLDARLAKTFTIKERYHLEADFNIYNMLNAVPPLTLNDTYGTNGATWLHPALTLPPRIAEFGVRADF